MCRSYPIRSWCLAALCGVLCFSAESPAATTSPKKSANSASTSSAKTSAPKKSSKKTKKSSKKRGQKAIDAERTQQIQEALIREHYLEGKPSGKWDDATQAALRRFQADQGWQSKSIPDSRALIKLGLGPNHHLLNPESAMTTSPVAADSKSGSKMPVADPPHAPAASAPADGAVPQQ